MLRVALQALVLWISIAATVSAQSTVFLVRHAERADSSAGMSPSMSSDPDLSEAGHARAASLATVLKDANITAIFVTKYKRTQQTAAPLAKALSLTPVLYKADEPADLMAGITRAKGNVLVIGHSNTVPDAVKALGVKTGVTIGDGDFDDLFVVRTGENPTLLRLHYR